VHAVPRALDALAVAPATISARTRSRPARRASTREPRGNKARNDEAPEALTLGASFT